MKGQFTTILFLLITNLIFSQTLPQKLNETNFSIGKSIEIKSSSLGENRKLNIYLPASYEKDSIKTYPVIYLLDGSREEDFIHISGIVQFASFSWVNMIAESIVVGIENVDRKRDFTYPSSNSLDKKEFPTSGNSKNFIEFIEKELQPFIDSTYRISGSRTLIGQSLGGLLATEILLKKPELFDNYIIVSPSLWWDDEKLLDIQPAPYNSNKSIYIAVGKEGEIMERTVKELYVKLKIIKNQNTYLFYEYLEERSHGDALHVAVYNAFEKIFQPKKP